MNPHPVPRSEDELSLDSDERTLIVTSERFADLAGLDAANLFTAEPENDADKGDPGAAALRFDRRSGGLVSGDRMGAAPVSPLSMPPSLYPSRGPARRRWLGALAALACIGALTLAAYSALHADSLGSSATQLLSWLDAHTGLSKLGR